jgi:hypothetical protein
LFYKKGVFMMKNILSTIAVIALAISITNHTSELTMRRTGTERLTQNIQTAIAKKKIGLLERALIGAGHGAVIGTLIGTGIGEAAQIAYTGTHNFDDLIKSILAGQATGAATGAAVHVVETMSNKNFSAAWLAQLEKLATKDENGEFKYISDKLMTIGVPIDLLEPLLFTPGVNNELIKDYGMVYLLAKGFDDASKAHRGSGYRIYIMPKDEYLGDVFLHIRNLIDIHGGFKLIKGEKKLVSSLAILPTPGVSKSLWSGKNLPRIIIELDPDAQVEDARGLIRELMLTLSQYDGIGYRPRYSEEIVGSHKLIYAGKGSGDFKESAKGQEEYRSMKSKSWWRLLSSDVEDMAYPTEAWRIGTVE